MSTQQGIRGRLEALQHRLSQTAETVTRQSRILVESSDVDDLNPPDDIEEYHEFYTDVGIVRGNINQFVRDVAAPGVRIEANDPLTEAYFTGEPSDEAAVPEFAPSGGYLDNCAVIAGETNQPFYPYLKSSVTQKYTRGTNLHEYIKSTEDRTDPDFQIQGFKQVRPETVSARTHANTNILLQPDETELVTTDQDITPRGEAAAYIQFDEQSIVGRKIGGFEDKDQVPLSQNDVLKQTVDPDIGGDDATEEGIFGTSPIAAVAEDIAEYQQIKRDRSAAIRRKAWGVWSAQFNTEFTESSVANEVILEEWDEEAQADWLDDVGELGPGDIVGHDGSIELDQWEPADIDIIDDLLHLVDDILAALPAPKYATAHGEQITQHVTAQQRENYRDLVHEERKAQSRDWTQAFREVAERHPRLDPAGLSVEIAPEASSNPVAELDDEEIQKMESFMSALNNGLGDVPIDLVLDVRAFLQTTMDLPDEVFADAEVDADEAAANLQDELENALTGGDNE